MVQSERGFGERVQERLIGSIRGAVNLRHGGEMHRSLVVFGVMVVVVLKDGAATDEVFYNESTRQLRGGPNNDLLAGCARVR